MGRLRQNLVDFLQPINRNRNVNHVGHRIRLSQIASYFIPEASFA